jgi:hypothetical protein
MTERDIDKRGYISFTNRDIVMLGEFVTGPPKVRARDEDVSNEYDW